MPFCWGSNDEGQTDIPVNLDKGALAISAGIEHNCVIEKNGGVQCWGYNGYGQSDVPLLVSNQNVVYNKGYEKELEDRRVYKGNFTGGYVGDGRKKDIS